MVVRTVAWCIGVLLAAGGLLAAVVLGFGAFLGPAEAQAGKELDGPAAAAREFARRAGTDPGAALRSCVPARATDFDALAGALPAGAVAAEQRYVVPDAGLALLAAPVIGEDLAESDGDRAVWAYGRAGFAAVTDDARALTPDLPGPELYGLDPEAPAVVRAATCVEAAQRVPTASPDRGPAVPTGTPRPGG